MQERYCVCFKTTDGVISGTIIGDFDAGVQRLMAKNANLGPVTDIITVERLSPVDNDYNKKENENALVHTII